MGEIINIHGNPIGSAPQPLLDSEGNPVAASGVPPEVEMARQQYFDGGNGAPPADRSGVMPFDRSGKKTRQQVRQEQRKAEAEARAQAVAQAEAQKELHKPVSVGQHQQAMFHVFSAIEKVVGEFRKLSIRHESLLRAAIEKGILTAEEFSTQAKIYVEFNQFIDAMNDLLRSGTPIQEVVGKVREYNGGAAEDNAQRIKIEWHHLDLAPRLLADTLMTDEEKVTVAAELGMPESYIEQLRNISKGVAGNPLTEAPSLAE